MYIICISNHTYQKNCKEIQNQGTSSAFVRTPSARAAKALLIVAAVSSMIGLAMSRTNRGLELKNVAAASAKIRKKKNIYKTQQIYRNIYNYTYVCNRT